MKFLMLFNFVTFSALSFENCSHENLKEMEVCSLANYKKEDDYLNYLYRSAAFSYPELSDDLKKIQHSWIKARDIICAASPVDGEEYKIYKYSCLYEQTYERNRELKLILLKKSSNSLPENSARNSLWNKYLKEHCVFMRNKFTDDYCEKRNEFLHSYD
ncbi:lysozyme inhibitor LprI family protein [Cronobacter malonaticus]